MTPQEQQLLEDFLTRLDDAGGVERDMHADHVIARRFAEQPDAAYLLVQRAMLMEQALDVLGSRKTERQVVPNGGPDLDVAEWGSSTQPCAGPQSALIRKSWRDRLFGHPRRVDPQARAGSRTSFLGLAATTAAGVVGGMFLFQGVERLFDERADIFEGSIEQQVVAEQTARDTRYDSPGDYGAGFDDDPWA